MFPSSFRYSCTARCRTNCSPVCGCCPSESRANSFQLRRGDTLSHGHRKISKFIVVALQEYIALYICDLSVIGDDQHRLVGGKTGSGPLRPALIRCGFSIRTYAETRCRQRRKVSTAWRWSASSHREALFVPVGRDVNRGAGVVVAPLNVELHGPRDGWAGPSADADVSVARR